MARTSMMVGLAVGVGLLGGYFLSGLLEIRVADKVLSGLELPYVQAEVLPPAADAAVPADAATAPAGLPPLPLRLVDAGGVGIPADTAAWGGTYSHATHAFDQLVLDGPPWIDPVRSAAVREDWRRYLRRMRRYGNNGVVLDAFLELVSFDALGDGGAVYAPDDALRQRHLAFQSMLEGFAWDARELGLDVYLKTDLPVVTPPLERYLNTSLPGADPGDAAFWEVYAAALEEVFLAMPELAGVVVRIGEGGPLYNIEGLEYASYVGVKEPAQLQQMLRTLLPVFERHGRTMIFRSWSVGVGALGELHNEAPAYEAVLGSIDSPALIVSTKFVQGDYFGFLPLNPTLLAGGHRRIVELQARREYEGFGALPNFLAHAHGQALRAVRAANPNVVGTYLWTQEGGPLRAGPLSLYEVVGFWRWTDANVHASSRLAIDASATPEDLAADWVRSTFGDDPEVVEGLSRILLDSREALEKALYIRPYAVQRVEVMGVEVPPILQVFEWDVLAGWSSVLATLYRTMAGDVETSIAEGYEALALSREMRARLAELEPRLTAHPDYGGLARSLEYQESLYEVLAEFRATFLLYYRWLDQGGDPSAWREAAGRFLAAAGEHERVFAADLDFPAFDVSSAVEAAERALAAEAPRNGARALALGLALLLALGAGVGGRRAATALGHAPRALWLGALAPHRVAGELPDGRRPSWLLGAATLAVVVTATGLLASGSWKVAAGAGALALAYTVALAASWQGSWGGRAGQQHAPAALGPLLLAALFVLAVIGLRGVDAFWLLFWTDNLFRAALFGIALSAGLWSLLGSYRAGLNLSGRRSFAAGGVLIACGFALIVLGVALPDLESTLAALDDPLHLVPMRRAIINGVTHYAGISEAAVRVPGAVGGAMMLIGAGLRRIGRHGRS